MDAPLMAGCAGLESIDPLCRAHQVVQQAGSDLFSSIATQFGNLANTSVLWLWRQLNVATSVDITTPGIRTDLIATGSIATLIALMLFLAQIIRSVLVQQGAGLGYAIRGLGVSFLGAAFAVAATQVVLGAVDSLSNGVVQFAIGTDMSGLGARLVAVSALTSIANPAELLLVSLVLLCAVVVIWVALMVRKMLIIISAVFAPVAFSGATNHLTSAWVRRWIEFTLALVMSKLILVIIFMIGLTVLEGGGQPDHRGATVPTQSVTNLLVGVLTLLLAGFAPWMAVKMVHFAGDSFHVMHAQVDMAASGAQRAIAAPRRIAATMGPLVGGAMASTAAGGAATSSPAKTSSQGGPRRTNRVATPLASSLPNCADGEARP